jgi:heat shock protein HtpX
MLNNVKLFVLMAGLTALFVLVGGAPLDLASALQKLDAAARRVPMQIAPSYAPMAQVDPLQAHGRGLLSMFSTHPPVAERVARLEAMARDNLGAAATA